MDFNDFPRILGKSGCESHPPPQDMSTPSFKTARMECTSINLYGRALRTLQCLVHTDLVPDTILLFWGGHTVRRADSRSQTPTGQQLGGGLGGGQPLGMPQLGGQALGMAVAQGGVVDEGALAAQR